MARRPQPVIPQGPPTPAEGYLEEKRSRLLFTTLAVVAALRLPVTGQLRRRRGARYSGPPPVCEPGGPDVVISGVVFRSEEKTYLILPFEVRPGTDRLEIEYDFGSLVPGVPQTPITESVLDLGLWDQRGYRSAEAFRGWSGKRHRRVSIEANRATRSYRPGPIGPGVWYAELGLASVGPTGARWTVTIRAVKPPPPAPPVPSPVDPDHVANTERNWYHGDFHMHSWHSNAHGPTPEQFVGIAREAGLDFLPVTEYVVGLHWDEYGPIQRDNPDLLLWPGREIITYFGHMQCIGETPGFIEYRHGFEDVRVADIQKAVVAAGALFQVNHPATFPCPVLRNLCRGCAFDLVEEIDWNAVDTIEVLTGAGLIKHKVPRSGKEIEFENPFMSPAVEFWEQLLNDGFPITAVCGSDVKEGHGLGGCATAVYSDGLSRKAIAEALRAGRAYVRTRGVADSPALGMTARTDDGQTGGFGARFVVAPGTPVHVKASVAGGAGQRLRIIRNGAETAVVPIEGDEFEHEFDATRTASEGPLGTWWRLETFDAHSRTTIGNPLFLGGSARPNPASRPTAQPRLPSPSQLEGRAVPPSPVPPSPRTRPVSAQQSAPSALADSERAVEIRIHGVGGSTPEGLLGEDHPHNAEPVPGAGDARCGVWARVREPNTQGFVWGPLTSQSPFQALWIVLFPFTLLNAAGWMHERVSGSKTAR